MQQIRRSIADCIADAPFVSVRPEDPVLAAVDGMRARRTNCALVVDDSGVVGIFTGRDFLTRIALADRDPAATTMREVMTPDPITLSSFDCVSWAIHTMAVKGIRNLPVVDADGRPVSVLDTRLVMMHLVKVFAELDGDSDDPEAAREWIDIGGG